MPRHRTCFQRSRQSDYSHMQRLELVAKGEPCCCLRTHWYDIAVSFSYAWTNVHRFLLAFQHLEKIGKVRYARFTNTQDIVPLIPFHGITRGGAYKHVGMHVRLHGVHKLAQYWLRDKLDVTYPKNHGWFDTIWRGLRVNIIRNLNTVQGKRVWCHFALLFSLFFLTLYFFVLHIRLQENSHSNWIPKAN